MTATVAGLWRHPIKGLGSQPLPRTDLTAGQPMPMDRAWALLHDRAQDTDAWQPRKNFLVVAHGPRLAQITAGARADGQLTLSHPDLPSLTFAPDTEADALIRWVTPLWPETQPAPTRLVRAPAIGMGDNGLAQLSVMNLASLRALSQRMGTPLDPRRFRGNLWLDGLAPWQEFDLIGRTLRIGDVELAITERIERCRATEANPDTGFRDVSPVRALHQDFAHRDFGVYATVMTSGTVSVGQEALIQ